MNFLEALEELNKLNEASDQYQIPDEFKFSKIKDGNCPGCGEPFKNAKDYEQHITGFYREKNKGEFELVKSCEKAMQVICQQK